MGDNVHTQIIERLKASGIFDQFRKECIADVDTKPAYINLHSRVVQSVDDYLKNVHWSSKLVRFGVREGMRKQIVESSYFQKGVDRIVNQTVDPKINTSFFPVIENAVYEFLGVQKPCGEEPKEESEEDKKCWVQPMDIDPPQESNSESQDLKIDLDQLPDQPEDIKPVVNVKVEVDEETNDSKLVIVENSVQDDEKMEEDDEEESPPFEVIGLTSPPHPLSGISVVEDDQKPIVNDGTDVQMTDFSNCFAKPILDREQLSNDSSDVTDSCVFASNPVSERKESKSSSSKESSSKDRSGSSSASKKSSEKEKDRTSSSSNRDRSSSSHSHSKSKSSHRDHSSSRDKDKSYRDKSSDCEKDKNKKEYSSSKYGSKTNSDSKHSRSSHSSSSRRHSSTGHSRDSRSGSDKNRTSDEKSSSKYKEKDSKVSSSHKESSRSQSSSSKDRDKGKYSSSSRKSSSSRSGHDNKSNKSKSSSKCDREKSDSHRSSDESSNKAKNYEVASEELPSPLPPPPPATESPPSVLEQMSPDVNEGGLDTSQASFHAGSTPKNISDHEESALDKWYGSENAINSSDGSRSTSDLVSFSNTKLELPSSEHTVNPLPDDVETVSSNSPVFDREDNSNHYAYSPSIPCESEVQLASGAEEPCSTSLLDAPVAIQESEVVMVMTVPAVECEQQKRKSKAELIDSLKEITQTPDFIEKRKYLFELMDPFYDEVDIPASPPSNLPKMTVTIENYEVNNTMIRWLQRRGARVHLRK